MGEKMLLAPCGGHTTSKVVIQILKFMKSISKNEYFQFCGSNLMKKKFVQPLRISKKKKHKSLRNLQWMIIFSNLNVICNAYK